MSVFHGALSDLQPVTLASSIERHARYSLFYIVEVVTDHAYACDLLRVYIWPHGSSYHSLYIIKKQFQTASEIGHRTSKLLTPSRKRSK